MVLGQEFGQPKPVKLLDGGEYVSGGDAWLGHERSVDKLLLCIDFATADSPFGTLYPDDPLTPRSTRTCSLALDLRRNQLAHGAAGAGLSSALSSLLSSARGRVPGPTFVAVLLIAMPGWSWPPHRGPVN